MKNQTISVRLELKEKLEKDTNLVIELNYSEFNNEILNTFDLFQNDIKMQIIYYINIIEFNNKISCMELITTGMKVCAYLSGVNLVSNLTGIYIEDKGNNCFLIVDQNLNVRQFIFDKPLTSLNFNTELINQIKEKVLRNEKIISSVVIAYLQGLHR